MDRQTIGKDAEKHAETFLKSQKLKLISRNYSCRFGEIDLIMQDRSTLVFVEVRHRKSRSFGGAAASVTRTKQQRIIKTAKWFLSQKPTFQKMDCRFDVIAFEDDAAPNHPLWYKGAFSATD